MNNAPAPASRQSGQQLTRAVMGLVVWVMLSAGKPTTNVPQETHVTQKKDDLAEARALLLPSFRIDQSSHPPHT